MPRETQEVRIGDHTFVAKSYATALEANAIQQAYFKGAKVEVVGEQPRISEFNPGVQFEVQKELIAQLVISFDGKDDDIVPRCLELPNDLFQQLVTKLDELVAKKKS